MKKDYNRYQWINVQKALAPEIIDLVNTIKTHRNYDLVFITPLFAEKMAQSKLNANNENSHEAVRAARTQALKNTIHHLDVLWQLVGFN